MIGGNTKFFSNNWLIWTVGLLKCTENKNIRTQSTSKLLRGVIVAIRSGLFANFSSSLFVFICFLHRVWRWGLQIQKMKPLKNSLVEGFLSWFSIAEPTHHNSKPGNWHRHPFGLGGLKPVVYWLLIHWFGYWTFSVQDLALHCRLWDPQEISIWNDFVSHILFSTRWGSFAICLARSHRSMSLMFSIYMSTCGLKTSPFSKASWLQEVEPVRSRTPTRRAFAPARGWQCQI